jgi:hypothetical protein
VCLLFLDGKIVVTRAMNPVVDDGDAAEAISKRRSNTNHCGAIAFPRDLAGPYGAGVIGILRLQFKGRFLMRDTPVGVSDVQISFHDDDETSFEFVVDLLQSVFGRSPIEANACAVTVGRLARGELN